MKVTNAANTIFLVEKLSISPLYAAKIVEKILSCKFLGKKTFL